MMLYKKDRDYTYRRKLAKNSIWYRGVRTQYLNIIGTFHYILHIYIYICTLHTHYITQIC